MTMVIMSGVAVSWISSHLLNTSHSLNSIYILPYILEETDIISCRDINLPRKENTYFKPYWFVTSKLAAPAYLYLRKVRTTTREGLVTGTLNEKSRFLADQGWRLDHVKEDMLINEWHRTKRSNSSRKERRKSFLVLSFNRFANTVTWKSLL